MHLSDVYIDQKITCKLAVDGDVEAAVRLINHAFSYQDKAKGDVRISKEKLKERMQKSEFYIFCDSNEEVVGCVYIDRWKASLHFGLLTVTDKYRGGELAGKIMSAIEEYATQLGANELGLDYMNLAPWLKKYYEKYGFSETGESENTGWCTLVRMRKRLK